MDVNKQVTITLSGKISYTDEISVSQATQIIAFIDSANTSLESLTPPPTSLGKPTKPKITTLTPREALEASGAQTNPEKIVAFAVNVSQEGDRDVFTLEDIRPLFKRSRESTPGNLNRDLDRAIKAGWVAESEEKGKFYVTDKAINVLRDGFDSIRSARGPAVKPRASGRRARMSTGVKRQNVGTVPEVFAGIDGIISPVIDGHVDYHKISVKEKFLWTVNAAKLLGVQAITYKELAWLSDQLGEGIPIKSMSVYFRRNQKDGYVNRSTTDDKIRITPKGTEHLQSLAAGVQE